MLEARLATLFCAAALTARRPHGPRQIEPPSQSADNTGQFQIVPRALHLDFTDSRILLKPYSFTLLLAHGSLGGTISLAGSLCGSEDPCIHRSYSPSP